MSVVHPGHQICVRVQDFQGWAINGSQDSTSAMAATRSDFVNSNPTPVTSHRYCTHLPSDWPDLPCVSLASFLIKLLSVQRVASCWQGCSLLGDRFEESSNCQCDTRACLEPAQGLMQIRLDLTNEDGNLGVIVSRTSSLTFSINLVHLTPQRGRTVPSVFVYTLASEKTGG